MGFAQVPRLTPLAAAAMRPLAKKASPPAEAADAASNASFPMCLIGVHFFSVAIAA